MLYELSCLFFIFTQILQNPHMYGPSHPILILRRAELFRLCAVGKKTALYDDDRHPRLLQQIIAVICLDLTLVLRIRPLHQLPLDALRQALPLGAAGIVE